MIIGLTGPAGSGKTFVGDLLVEEYGFWRVRFAGPLKDMLRVILAAAGRKPSSIEQCIEGALKETPLPELGGQSPRRAMQTLGTEWGRDQLGADFWTDLAIGAADRLHRTGHPVVIDDCRFDNEAEAINSLGGAVYQIEGRRNTRQPGDHVSERGVHHALVHDTINNTGGYELAIAEVERIVTEYRRA